MREKINHRVLVFSTLALAISTATLASFLSTCRQVNTPIKNKESTRVSPDETTVSHSGYSSLRLGGAHNPAGAITGSSLSFDLEVILC